MMYHTNYLPHNNRDDFAGRGQSHNFINVPGLNKEKQHELNLDKIVISGGQERIIGDNHFFDRNIIQLVPRPFSSVEEMNLYMIEQWNSVTSENDTVIINGDFIDFSNCSVEEGYNIINNLNGKQFTLIVGNHDKPYVEILKNYGPRLEVVEYPIIKNEFWIISHEPQYVSDAAPYANIFAHVHLNPMYRDVSSRSFCTSAERLDYKPILLREAMSAVINYKEN